MLARSTCARVGARWYALAENPLSLDPQHLACLKDVAMRFRTCSALLLLLLLSACATTEPSLGEQEDPNPRFASDPALRSALLDCLRQTPREGARCQDDFGLDTARPVGDNQRNIRRLADAKRYRRDFLACER
jgi:hypothetical protein